MFFRSIFYFLKVRHTIPLMSLHCFVNTFDPQLVIMSARGAIWREIYTHSQRKTIYSGQVSMWLF